jgi:hypothetical protein
MIFAEVGKLPLGWKLKARSPSFSCGCGKASMMLKITFQSPDTTDTSLPPAYIASPASRDNKVSPEEEGAGGVSSSGLGL